MHTWQGRLHGWATVHCAANNSSSLSSVQRGAALRCARSGVEWRILRHAYSITVLRALSVGRRDCDRNRHCPFATAMQSQQCVQLFDRHRKSESHRVGRSRQCAVVDCSAPLTHSLTAQMWAHIMPQRHAISCRRRPQCDAISTDADGATGAYTSSPDFATTETAAKSPRKSGVRHST